MRNHTLKFLSPNQNQENNNKAKISWGATVGHGQGHLDNGEKPFFTIVLFSLGKVTDKTTEPPVLHALVHGN